MNKNHRETMKEKHEKERHLVTTGRGGICLMMSGGGNEKYKIKSDMKKI